eukprot:250254_1
MSLTSTSVSSNQPLLTTTKLWAVFFVQLNEAYQITVLMPMVVFMCRDFGVEPRLLGIYTSILNASFCFCQFLCCYVWGLISDKYGRRKALVCGLIFSTIAILIFGLSKDFATALVARCVSGFFNGNLGVIKAYLADITDTTNRPWAFSILAISYGFGSVLGSMFGGILIVTNDVDVPWDQYQPTTGIIKFWIFEKQYPFLLPCLVGAIISFNALIWVLMFVHDEKVIYPRSLTQSTDYNTITSDLDSLVVSVLQDNSQRPKSLNELANLALVQTMAGDGIHNINLSLVSFHSTSARPRDVLLTPLSQTRTKSTELYPTALRLVFDTGLKHTLLIYTVLVMFFMMFQEMNPVYMAQALKFNSDFIGYSMAYSGLCLLLFVYYIQPWFNKTFKFRIMSMVCYGINGLMLLQMPSIYTVQQRQQEIGFKNETMNALILCCANLMVAICTASIIFVCSMCWLNNSVPNEYVGRANGLGQTGAALVRAIGPTMTGFIWSATVNDIEHNKLAVYYAYLPSFILCMFINTWIYLFITDDAQLVYEELQQKKRKQRRCFMHE